MLPSPNLVEVCVPAKQKAQKLGLYKAIHSEQQVILPVPIEKSVRGEFG